MKNLLFILLTTLLIVSCDNTESNSPAMQADVDNVLFRADFAEADYFNDGEYFILQGKADDEILTLRASYPPENVNLEFGGESENFATFERANGIIYSTVNEGGNGSMIINTLNATNNSISGDFRFTAVSVGQDTITVSGGIFFEVPFGNGVDETPNAGSFSAEVDGSPFTSIDVLANELGDSIVIQGIVNTKKIKITVPNIVEEGSFEFPASGFSASYIVDSEEEIATSGNIIIISHDLDENIIKGTFSFVTETNTITLGQFNVTYQ